ncbi:MAG: family 16 glycoside hydrolase, partial [Gaiellaceae bacterium]
IAAWLSLGAADSLHIATPPHSPQFKRPANALFADDFSSDSLRGWRADSLASVWKVRDGVLRGDLPDVKQAHAFLFAGDSSWTDYAVDFDICGMRGVDKGIGVRVSGKHGLGVDLRDAEHQDVLLFVNQFPVGSGKAENANGAWHHMRVEIRGNACRVTVNGHVVVDNHLRFRAPAHGGIALAAYAGGVGQCTVYYDNVVVTPLAGGVDP